MFSLIIDKTPAHSANKAQQLVLERKKYTLAGMIAECDLNVPKPSDIDAWDNLSPIGLEVL